MSRDPRPRRSKARDDTLTTCSHCQKPTKTILGVCPNCGRARPGSAVLGPERSPRRYTFWEDLDGLLIWGLVLAPGAVLFAALILLAGMDLLFAAAIVVVLLGVIGSVLTFGNW